MNTKKITYTFDLDTGIITNKNKEKVGYFELKGSVMDVVWLFGSELEYE